MNDKNRVQATTWGFDLREAMSLQLAGLKTRDLHELQGYGRSRAKLAASPRWLLEKNNRRVKEITRATDEPDWDPRS
ncbi:hypothetical protein ACHAQF_003957 [Verticillium nonalfalfae]